MTYQELKLALDIFQLDEHATMKQIKTKHRDLVKQHHPDQSPDKQTETIQKVNAAFELLTAYCENYQFSFSEEEFLKQNPEERLRRQFDGDPLWSGNKETDA